MVRAGSKTRAILVVRPSRKDSWCPTHSCPTRESWRSTSRRSNRSPKTWPPPLSSLARRFAAGRHHVVRLARLVGPRPPRGGRVRPPRDHGQAGPPCHLRQRRRPARVAAGPGAAGRRRLCALGTRRGWEIDLAAPPERGVGAHDASGSGPGRARRPAPQTTSCGSTVSIPQWPGTSGGYVLLYHLLWELVHVVFEHPGLLARAAGLHRRGVHHLLRRGRLVEVVDGARRRHRGRAGPGPP